MGRIGSHRSWKDGDYEVVAKTTDNANHTKRETVTLATQ